MDEHRSTTAESINARIERTVPFIRYVKGENLIPFLNIPFALLNVATRYRRQYATDDLEDADMWEFFKSSVTCVCHMCTLEGAQSILQRDEREYVFDESDSDRAETTSAAGATPDGTAAANASNTAEEPETGNRDPPASAPDEDDTEDEIEAIVIDSEAVELYAPEHVVVHTATARTNSPTFDVDIIDD